MGGLIAAAPMRFCASSATPPTPSSAGKAVPTNPPGDVQPEAPSKAAPPAASAAETKAAQTAHSTTHSDATSTCMSPADHATEILSAIRSRNFAEVQGKTQKLVASHWHDDYAIPLACLLCFIVTWYWQASSYRQIARNVQKVEANAIAETKALEEKVTEMRARIAKNLVNRTASLSEIQKQNSELTRVIDQMTTALKQCPPR